MNFTKDKSMDDKERLPLVFDKGKEKFWVVRLEVMGDVNIVIQKHKRIGKSRMFLRSLCLRGNSKCAVTAVPSPCSGHPRIIR